MFRVGDLVAYPMHGGGIVEAIEEKEILGQLKRYYILRFNVGGMKVMVPVNGISGEALRPIVSSEECVKVIEYISRYKECEDLNWNRRYRENLEKMRTGGVFDIAEVVQSLMCRERDKGLSTGEKKMLTCAKQILVSEIVLSTGKDELEVTKLIEQAV